MNSLKVRKALLKMELNSNYGLSSPRNLENLFIEVNKLNKGIKRLEKRKQLIKSIYSQ